MNRSLPAESRRTGFRLMFWVIVVPVALLVAVAFVAAQLFGGPVKGLTRLGPWPESDYIWQKDQPGFALLPNNMAITDPDVVVIGDSFSMPNAWQSVVSQKTGLSIKTYNYLNNNNCFLPWIEQMASGMEGQGKLIVVESIERLFMERFETPERCTVKSKFHISPVGKGFFSDSRSTGFTQIDLMRQLRTLNNMWQVHSNPMQPVGDWAVNVPLRRNDLFSNKRSDRLLYLKLDTLRHQWTPAQIGRAVVSLKTVQSHLEQAGFGFALMVIPDKLHVYEDDLLMPFGPHAATDLAKTLRQSGINAVDLLMPLKSRIYQDKDVYMPNDDHLGPVGQQILGDAVASFMTSRALTGSRR